MLDMKNFLVLAATLWITLFATHSAQAQGEQDSAKVQFYCASWDPMSDQLYFRSSKKKDEESYTPVDLSVMLRSQLYEVKASGTIPFFKKGKLSPEGEQLYDQVAVAKIPPGVRRVTLIFLKSKEGNLGIRTIPDDRKHSPFGGYQFFNMTNLTVYGTLGGKRFKIAPGKHATVKLSKSPGEALPYATFAEINGEKQWLERNTLTFNPKKHLKVFMLAEADKRGRVRIHTKGLAEFEPAPGQEGS